MRAMVVGGVKTSDQGRIPLQDPRPVVRPEAVSKREQGGTTAVYRCCQNRERGELGVLTGPDSTVLYSHNLSLSYVVKIGGDRTSVSIQVGNRHRGGERWMLQPLKA